MKRFTARADVRAALRYALFGGLWILLSDRAIVAFSTDPAVVSMLGTFKGLGFVALSALIMFGFLRGQALDAAVATAAQLRAEHDLARTARLYEMLSRTNQRIVHSTERAELLDGICTIAVRQGGFKLAWIGLRDGDGVLHPVAREEQEPGMLERVNVAAEPARGFDAVTVGEVLRTGVRTVNNDLLGDPALSAWREAALQAGLFAAAVLPIALRGELRGTLSLYAGEAGFFREKELATLDEMATDVAFGLDLLERGAERARMIAELAATEERLRLALDAGTLGIYDLDVVSGETIVSPQYALMLGFDPATFHETNADWIARLHPDDRASVSQAYVDYLAGRVPEYRVEFRQRTASGEWKWILSAGRIVTFDRDGMPKRMLGTHTDISRIKAAQVTIDRQRERAQSLLALSRSTEALDESAFLQHGLELGERLTGSTISFLHFVNEDEGTIQLVAWSRRTLAEYCTAVADAHYPIAKAGIWADAFRTREPAVFNDYATYAHRRGLPEGHAALDRLISVPVIEGGKVRVIVGVGNAEAAYTESDVETVQLLSEELWRIVSRRRAEAALIASESRHRRLFEANPHAMWVFDPDTLRFLDVNDTAIARYGWSREEFLAMTIDDIRAPGELAALHAHLSAVQGQATDDAGVWQHVTKDGRLLDVDISSHTVQFGDRMAWVVLAHDVTVQRRADALVQAGEERLRQTLALAGIAVWEVDSANGAISRSRLFDALFGLAFDAEYDEARYWPRIVAEDRETVRRAIAEAGVTSVTTVRFGTDFRVDWPDGSRHWLTLSGQVNPAADPRGAPVARGVLMEITDRKLAEERVAALHDVLAQRAAELEVRVTERTAELLAANEELDAFASAVSHDLRAPLRAMEGFGTALLARYHEQLDAQGRRYLDNIQSAVARMTALIGDLLDLSRLMRSTLHRQPVDLAAIAREIMAELHARDPLRLVRFVAPETVVLDGDAHLLRIAMQNLLDNAWKFTGTRPEAHITFGTVEGAATADGARAPREYFVRDDGVGFDVAGAAKLFMPFQRLHSASEFPGTGIGLATVQRVIARHGGRIWGEAQAGAGATFRFTLDQGTRAPLARASGPTHRPPPRPPT